MTERAAMPNLATRAASRGACSRRPAMNAVLSNQNTFSAPVQPARTQRPARRQLVGGYPVAQQALERFNLLLERLGRAPMDLDELATAARQLARPGGAE